MKEHFEKAIQYVRENASWSKACEEYALEIIGKYRCPIDQASSEIAEEIRDLILAIATGNLECPVGSIDYMEWLLNQ